MANLQSAYFSWFISVLLTSAYATNLASITGRLEYLTPCSSRYCGRHLISADSDKTVGIQRQRGVTLTAIDDPASWSKISHSPINLINAGVTLPKLRHRERIANSDLVAKECHHQLP
jgi:hypothetical protein